MLGKKAAASATCRRSKAGLPLAGSETACGTWCVGISSARFAVQSLHNVEKDSFAFLAESYHRPDTIKSMKEV